MSKHGFTVDEDVTEGGAKLALVQLRRMIKLGKLAERAMADIRSQGYTNRTVPIANRTVPQWNKMHSTVVSIVHMPRREPVSRADLTDLSKLQIALGIPEEDEYSGNPCIVVPMSIKGIMLTQTEQGLAVYDAVEEERSCGRLRINKNHVSWLEGNYSEAQKVYWEYRYAQAKSAPAFATALSRVIVNLGEGVDKRCGKTVMLHDQMPQWLCDDGHVARLFREIIEFCKVVKVMTA